MKVKADFSGGLDICFDGKKDLEIEVDGNQIVMKELIKLISNHCNPKKIDLFV